MKTIFLFSKSHVSGYTKHDGTVVAPHEDIRMAAQKKLPSRSISDMQTDLERAEPFSDEHQDLTEKLQNAVLKDVSRSIDAGEMPVYKISDHVSVAIHPSAQNSGMIQVTRYSRKGVMGDSQYRSLAEAVNVEGLWMHPKLSEGQAEQMIGQSITEEQAYNDRKSLNKSIFVILRPKSAQEK